MLPRGTITAVATSRHLAVPFPSAADPTCTDVPPLNSHSATRLWLRLWLRLTPRRTMPFDSRPYSTSSMTAPSSPASPMPFRTAARSVPRSRSATGMLPKVRVHVNDRELYERARSAASRIDVTTVQDSARFEWGMHRSYRNGFATFKSNASALNQPLALLTTGEIRCGLAELARVLSSTTDCDLNAVMGGLHPKDHIYGSVVRAVPLSGHGGGHVAVKTSTFVRSSMWSPNEQWCYLELATPIVSTATATTAGLDQFTVTLSSMTADDIGVGKAAEHGGVDQLHGLSAGYLVQQVPHGRYVRVVFFAQFDDQRAVSRAADGGRVAPPSAVYARLLRLAHGATNLPEVVRRRRLGAQTLADRKAFVATNSHCICCTKSLLVLLTRKKQCHLCGHHVCDKCWIVHALESQFGHVSTVRVCTRCLEFVESGDYDEVDPLTLGPPQIHRDKDADASAKSGKKLARMLHEELRSSNGARRTAVLKVIRQLVDGGGSDSIASDGGKSLDDGGRSASLKQRRQRVKLTDCSSEQEHVEALRSGIHVEQIPLYECALANGDGRSYPMTIPQSVAVVPESPEPSDELRRQDVIRQGKLMHLQETSELDLLCSLAAKEMGCAASILTIVGGTDTKVVASNRADLRPILLPRNQSFCQHTIMNDKPLLAPHPEADIRFHNIAARAKHEIRFYFGVPLKVADETVVGSFCCLDTHSHEVTQSQYSSMTKLAAAASQLVQLQSLELTGRQRRQPAGAHARRS